MERSKPKMELHALIQEFEALKNEKQIRRSKEQIQAVRDEYDTNAKEDIEQGKLKHTTFYPKTASYTVAVRIDGKDYVVSCSSLHKAKTAAELAKKIRDAKLAEDKKLPSDAPIEFFGEAGWIRYRDSTFYFHREKQYYCNGHKTKRKNRNYGDNQGYICDQNHQSIKFIDALHETFFGPTPEGYFVSKIDENGPNLLSNLQCVKMECSVCSKPITFWMGRRFCSNLCQQRSNPRNLKCYTDLRRYLADKTKRYACSVDDAVKVCEYRTCAACGLTDLNLRNEYKYDPRKLVIDCIQPFSTAEDAKTRRRENHCKENIQALCFMCNSMKHNATAEKFMKLISFLKGDSDLDLRNENFVRIGTNVSKKQSKFMNMFRVHDPTIQNAQEIAKHLFEKQDKMDAVFAKFPIAFFKDRSIFSCSVDQIVPHHPEHGFQLLPLFMNFAKGAGLSNETLKMEFEARGFLKANHDKHVLLPDDYQMTSYTLCNIGVTGHARRKLAKGHSGMKRNTEVCKKISSAKKGKPNLKGRREMRLFAICKKTQHRSGPFTYFEDAISELRLSKHAAGNIMVVLSGKWKYAYGYEWVDELRKLEKSNSSLYVQNVDQNFRINNL